MKTLQEFTEHYKITDKEKAQKDYELYQKNLSIFNKIIEKEEKNNFEKDDETVVRP
jgi:hypothetical protein